MIPRDEDAMVKQLDADVDALLVELARIIGPDNGPRATATLTAAMMRVADQLVRRYGHAEGIMALTIAVQSLAVCRHSLKTCPHNTATPPKAVH